MKGYFQVALIGGPLDGEVVECATRPDHVGYMWVRCNGNEMRYISYVYTGMVRRLRTVFARFDRETVRKIVP